jgi:hypothetical protein
MDDTTPEKKPKRQRVVFDLERNKELDRIAGEHQVGDELEATIEIVAHEPGRTLTVELVEVVGEESDEADEDGEDTPAMKVARGA